MRIDLTSLMFNMNLKNHGGTPSWGTSLGQGEGHKLTYTGCEEILVAMVYKKLQNTTDVFCPLGKGGKKQDEYEYVLASKFDKVYVNDNYIPNSSFVLLIVKQLVAGPSAEQHIGRRTLKYSPKITYKGINYNQICFNNINHELKLSDNAAWFVSDINIINQDEIHFIAKIVDANKSKEFTDSNSRTAFCENRAEVTLECDLHNKKTKVKKTNDFDFNEPIIVGKKIKEISIK